MSIYKEKYLKYKMKYTQLKSQKGGVKSLVLIAFEKFMEYDPETGEKILFKKVPHKELGEITLERPQDFLSRLNIWETESGMKDMYDRKSAMKEYVKYHGFEISSVDDLLLCDDDLYNLIYHLYFTKSFDQEISALENCHNLQTLIFTESFDQEISALGNCHNLQTLIFGYWFNQEITALENCSNLQKLTFGYELFLRMTHNSMKIMTIPKIGYKHINLREGSIFWNYKNGDNRITQDEAGFWIESAKKEYFYTSEREINYEPQEI